MIKAIIFDLDGVLVDADKWHFNALNVALQHTEVDPISWQEHLTIYKGIPTRKKLEILTERKGLPRELWDKINVSKQEITFDIISKFCTPDLEKIEMINVSKQEITFDIISKFCTPDLEKIEMMRLLKRKYPIVICSNAIRPTVELMLQKSGLLPFVDFYLSNQDVKTPKPDPEIYRKAFERLGLYPDECAIVEDSDVGKRAAVASGGILCSVAGPAEVNYYRILKTIIGAEQVDVVIPAAGQGKRFSEAGYQHPKPLIDVDGKPMIQLVLDNFFNVGRLIFILQKKHIDQYCADAVVKHLSPGSEVVQVDGLTEGAVCTVLKARDLINNGNELVIANSDQVVDMDVMDFVRRMRRKNADGGILTFADNDPKWSYARTDDSGRVSEVAEKIVISNQATVGIYYYRRGGDFVKYAEQMIRKNIRVNNEFYVCPVFNEFIADGKAVFSFEIGRDRMHGLGTPEDLERFATHGIQAVAA